MASAIENEETATKYKTMMKNIVGGLRAAVANYVWHTPVPTAKLAINWLDEVTKMRTFWNGLTAPQQASFNTLVGVTATEWGVVRDQLITTIFNDLTAVQTAGQAVNIAPSLDAAAFAALVNSLNTLKTDTAA